MAGEEECLLLLMPNDIAVGILSNLNALELCTAAKTCRPFANALAQAVEAAALRLGQPLPSTGGLPGTYLPMTLRLHYAERRHSLTRWIENQSGGNEVIGEIKCIYYADEHDEWPLAVDAPERLIFALMTRPGLYRGVLHQVLSEYGPQPDKESTVTVLQSGRVELRLHGVHADVQLFHRRFVEPGGCTCDRWDKHTDPYECEQTYLFSPACRSRDADPFWDPAKLRGGCYSLRLVPGGQTVRTRDDDDRPFTTEHGDVVLTYSNGTYTDGAYYLWWLRYEPPGQ